MPRPSDRWLCPVALAGVAGVAGPPSTSVGAAPDALVVAAAAWAAWLLSGAAVAALLLAMLSRGGGRVAATARMLLRAAPAPLRRWATAVVAAAVGVAAAAPASAAAATAPRPRPAVAPALGWPQAPTVPAGRAHPHPSVRTAVVVRPGDCLWSVAARDLGRDATATRVAAAWPLWWAANRASIGADPDLVIPGQRLLRPTRLDERTSP